MTRVVRAAVLAVYASSPVCAALALCPCRWEPAAAHECCAKAGLNATASCCQAPAVHAKAPAVPEYAVLALFSAPRALALELPVRAVAVTSRRADPASSPSPPFVLRI